MTTDHETARLYVNAWRLMVPRLPSGTVQEVDGVIATLGNVELSFLNCFFAEGPLVDGKELRRRLTTAKSLAMSSVHPWFFALCDDWLPQGWESVVESEGLAVALSLTGMTSDGLRPPRRSLPHLEFRRVEDEATARHIAEVNAFAYSMPLEVVECICNLHLWKPDSYGYVAYIDGEPVACSSSFPVDDTVYVGFVATHPDHQRRGYAEAVMRHSITRGMEGMGLSRTSLHATEAGRPLYEAMGYEGNGLFHLVAQPHA